MRILTILLYLIFSYSIGSFNSAYLLTLLFLHRDIRNYGDGNAGTTNVFENVSKSLAILVFCLDFIKGLIPIYLGQRLSFNYNVVAIGGALEILGHDFPIFFELRGGTGITSLLGGIFALDKYIALSLSVFFIISFSFFSILNRNLFGLRPLEQSEALSFLVAIGIIIKSDNILLKEYFFLSLIIIVYRHWRKALYIFSKSKVFKS